MEQFFSGKPATDVTLSFTPSLDAQPFFEAPRNPRVMRATWNIEGPHDVFGLVNEGPYINTLLDQLRHHSTTYSVRETKGWDGFVTHTSDRKIPVAEVWRIARLRRLIARARGQRVGPLVAYVLTWGRGQRHSEKVRERYYWQEDRSCQANGGHFWTTTNDGVVFCEACGKTR